MLQNNKKKSRVGLIMALSGIIGFVLDAFLVSNLMVIEDGGTAVIIIGFILAILLFLLSLILTISGFAMMKEVRRMKKKGLYSFNTSEGGTKSSSSSAKLPSTASKAKSTTKAAAKKTTTKKSTTKKVSVKRSTAKGSTSSKLSPKSSPKAATAKKK